MNQFHLDLSFLMYSYVIVFVFFYSINQSSYLSKHLIEILNSKKLDFFVFNLVKYFDILNFYICKILLFIYLFTKQDLFSFNIYYLYWLFFFLFVQ